MSTKDLKSYERKLVLHLLATAVTPAILKIQRFFHSLRRRFHFLKKTSVKLVDPFLLTETLERSVSYFAMILPQEIADIYNIFRIKVVSFHFNNSSKILLI